MSTVPAAQVNKITVLGATGQGDTGSAAIMAAGQTGTEFLFLSRWAPLIQSADG